MGTAFGTTLLLCVTLLVASRSGAQESTQDTAVSRDTRIKTVSLIAGVSQFDLSGTGTAALIGARADMELNRWFLGEVGFTTMRPLEQFGQRATYALPELQLQVQLPFSVVRPYVGAGVGFATAFAQGAGAATTGTVAVAVAVAGGLRVVLPGTRTIVRTELRVRGLGTSFSGSMADWAVGLGRRF